MPAEIRSQVLQRVILLLEPERLRILEILILFLRELAKYSDKTLMNSHNLAIVFAPNILRSGSDNPGQVITDAKATLEIVHLLLTDTSIALSHPNDSTTPLAARNATETPTVVATVIATAGPTNQEEFRRTMQENYEAMRKDSSVKLEKVARKSRVSQIEFHRKMEQLSQKILDGEIDPAIFDQAAGVYMDPSLIAQFSGMDQSSMMGHRANRQQRRAMAAHQNNSEDGTLLSPRSAAQHQEVAQPLSPSSQATSEQTTIVPEADSQSTTTTPQPSMQAASPPPPNASTSSSRSNSASSPSPHDASSPPASHKVQTDDEDALSSTLKSDHTQGSDSSDAIGSNESLSSGALDTSHTTATSNHSTTGTISDAPMSMKRTKPSLNRASTIGSSSQTVDIGLQRNRSSHFTYTTRSAAISSVDNASPSGPSSRLGNHRPQAPGSGKLVSTSTPSSLRLNSESEPSSTSPPPSTDSIPSSSPAAVTPRSSDHHLSDVATSGSVPTQDDEDLDDIMGDLLAPYHLIKSPRPDIDTSTKSSSSDSVPNPTKASDEAAALVTLELLELMLGVDGTEEKVEEDDQSAPFPTTGLFSSPLVLRSSSRSSKIFKNDPSVPSMSDINAVLNGN